MNEIPSRKLLCKFYNFKDLKCRSHSDMNMKLIVTKQNFFGEKRKLFCIDNHQCVFQKPSRIPTPSSGRRSDVFSL